MAYQNQYNDYKLQAINTMTSGELLILLYDELIKRLKRAKLSVEIKENNIFMESMQRSRDIVNYLNSTLDNKYPISAELRRLYTYMNQEIAYIIPSQNVSKIDDLIPMVEDMRNTWAEANKISKSSKR